MKEKIKKIIRFSLTYGFLRALIKAFGRIRSKKIALPNFEKERYISFAGAGQFAFSTILFFLYFNKKKNFLGVYDIDDKKSETIFNFYKIKIKYESFSELIDDKNCKLLYIASNHASHTPYAIEALKRNIDVYIEKPLATSMGQFKKLYGVIKNSKSRVFVGYNRPFSKAITFISKKIKNKCMPISMSCFVSGHLLGANHWYRNPKEGTRICGNMGHWIDLSVHLLHQKGECPNLFQISINYSNLEEPDDNVCVSITTNQNDIFSIFLSARTEPFEGINESIDFQLGNLIAKIDDFRKLTIWEGAKKLTKKFRIKDVGHKKAILQPFNGITRNFDEIKISTILMLNIADMVKERKRNRSLDIEEEIKNLE